MDEENPLHDRDAGPQSGNAPTPPAGPVPGRRRLLTGGLSATGVVMTLASRPVLAWHCQSPSAYASGNTSRPAQTFADENTKTISYWQTASSWPSPFVKSSTITVASTKFNDYFPSSYSNDKSMKWVLNNGSTYEKYIIAAALNVAWSKNSTTTGTDANLCLSLSELQEIWNGVRSGGYIPSPGATPWGQSKVIEYLQKNWIVTG